MPRLHLSRFHFQEERKLHRRVRKGMRLVRHLTLLIVFVFFSEFRETHFDLFPALRAPYGTPEGHIRILSGLCYVTRMLF